MQNIKSGSCLLHCFLFNLSHYVEFHLITAKPQVLWPPVFYALTHFNLKWEILLTMSLCFLSVWKTHLASRFRKFWKSLTQFLVYSGNWTEHHQNSWESLLLRFSSLWYWYWNITSREKHLESLEDHFNVQLRELAEVTGCGWSKTRVRFNIITLDQLGYITEKYLKSTISV